MWNWLMRLALLSDADKSRIVKPPGMSRRGFIRALGVTAVTVTGAGLIVPKTKLLLPGLNPTGYSSWRNLTCNYSTLNGPEISRLVELTLGELGRPNFLDIAADLKKHDAMRELLNQPSSLVSFNAISTRW
jgi:hypothetical protein